MAKGEGNYQAGGPTGRERGTQSFTAKRRVRGVKGAKTEAVHVRCKADGSGGELCAWMQLQFAKILDRASRAESDEKAKRKAAKQKAAKQLSSGK